MSDKAKTSEELHSDALLNRLLIILIIISTAGIGFWILIQHLRDFLPSPDTEFGRTLLLQYQELTYSFWLLLLVLSVGYLINRIYFYSRKEAKDSDKPPGQPIAAFLRFIHNNPLTALLLAAYGIAMISGTTYLYRDMFGWYPELIKGHFLNNFTLRGTFIDETMRRTDYRFFPLAHQDLHILSWFSIHIKTWMLFSIAELIGIILLSIRFLEKLNKNIKVKSSTILLFTAIFALHPSAGTAFFHVIYCERLLCLVFMLYATSYLHHQETKNRSSFYCTLLWALLGIYIKDIAVILFVVPPACLWAWDAINSRNSANQISRASLRQKHKLERWICSLSILFITSYIILALIPSNFAAEEAYNQNSTHEIIFDLRFYIFAFIFIIRGILVTRGRINFILLDAINLSSFAYAFALGATHIFNAYNYLALPCHLIATINIAWLWNQLIEKRCLATLGTSKQVVAGFFASAALIGGDHAIGKETFYNNTIQLKSEQSYAQKTFEKLDKVTRNLRESGENVTIIINYLSRFSAKRHLRRIPYYSLVEYIPSKKEFRVVDGAHKGDLYSPKVGDIVVNLDKSIDLIDPIIRKINAKEIYRHNPTMNTGIILRITKLKF